VQQWFNLVLPSDLPQLIAALEKAAVGDTALQLRWRQHVAGFGVQAYEMFSGVPLRHADGSQSWVCSVRQAA
jgi:hypothetical protein